MCSETVWIHAPESGSNAAMKRVTAACSRTFPPAALPGANDRDENRDRDGGQEMPHQAGKAAFAHTSDQHFVVGEKAEGDGLRRDRRTWIETKAQRYGQIVESGQDE